MVRITPLQDDFVAAVLAELNWTKNLDFRDELIVFPSLRLKTFLLEELGRRCSGPFFPPRLYSAEQFFGQIFDLNFPGFSQQDELRAASLVQQAARKVYPGEIYGGFNAQGDFSTFFPWALKLLAAIDEILVDGHDLSEINQKTFSAFAGLGDYHFGYSEFIAGLPSLVREFSRLCRQSKSAGRAFRLRCLAESAVSGNLTLPEIRHWVFAAFNTFNRCEKSVLKRIIKEKKADTLFIIRSDPALFPEADSPFAQQLAGLKELGLQIPSPAHSAPTWNRFSDRVKVHQVTGKESEMALVSELLRGISRQEDISRPGSIGIVLADPTSLVPFLQGVVSRFPGKPEDLPFNITLGYPLQRTPLYQLVNNMLQLWENSGQKEVRGQDYLGLLGHPYTRQAENSTDNETLARGLDLLAERIRSGNLINCNYEQVLREITDLDEIRQAKAAGLELRAWHNRFIPPARADLAGISAHLLQVVLWLRERPAFKSYLLFNDIAQSIQESLQNLVDFASEHEESWPGEPRPKKTAALIRHFLSRIRVHFEGSPLAGVQVMGLLEFRGLRFQRVIICDALEGILPQSHKYDPLLPYDLRRVLGLRLYPEQEKLYAYNFFSLVGGAGRVDIICPQENSGEYAEASRFIKRIVFEAEQETGQWQGTIPVSLELRTRPPELNRVEKDQKTREFLAGRTFSPSALELYLNCPLRFYYSRVLELKEPDKLIEDSDQAVCGTLIHKILQQVFAARTSSGPGFPAGAELRILLEQQARLLDLDPENGLEKIRLHVVQKQVEKYLQSESKRLEEADERIVIVGLESKLQGEITLEAAARAIVLQGRIDRLERQGELLRVIDYKSGAVHSFKAGQESLLPPELYKLEAAPAQKARREFRKNCRHFQLLCYMLLLQINDRSGDLDGAFAFLREEKKFFYPLSSQLKDQLSRQAALAAFKSDLVELLNDILLRPEFSADPGNPGYCAHCPYRTACGNLS